MDSKSKVYFHFDNTRVTLRDRLKLKRAIEGLFKKEKVDLLSLSYIFCSDEVLLGINRKFLQHDYYTDIVTFNYSNHKSPVTGEAYISVTRVRENALTLKTSITEELLRVVFHGALHLCGYNDKSAKGKAEMRKKENFYLSRMNKRST